MILLAAGLLLLPACGLRTWVDVSIAEDSTGTVTLQVASDQELRDGLATFSPDADPVDQITSGLTEQGWAIEPAPDDGEWEGVIATRPFANPDELESLLGEALQGGDSSFELAETDSGYSFSAALGPPDSDTNEADLFAQASEVIELDGRLSMEFPGDITSSNGEVSAEGNVVTWTYDEETIVGLEVNAEAEKPGQNTVVIVVLLVVGLLLGWFLATRLRQRSKAQPLLEVES